LKRPNFLGYAFLVLAEFIYLMKVISSDLESGVLKVVNFELNVGFVDIEGCTKIKVPKCLIKYSRIVFLQSLQIISVNSFRYILDNGFFNRFQKFFNWNIDIEFFQTNGMRILEISMMLSFANCVLNNFTPILKMVI